MSNINGKNWGIETRFSQDAEFAKDIKERMLKIGVMKVFKFIPEINAESTLRNYLKGMKSFPKTENLILEGLEKAEKHYGIQ